MRKVKLKIDNRNGWDNEFIDSYIITDSEFEVVSENKHKIVLKIPFNSIKNFWCKDFEVIIHKKYVRIIEVNEFKLPNHLFEI